MRLAGHLSISGFWLFACDNRVQKQESNTSKQNAWKHDRRTVKFGAPK